MKKEINSREFTYQLPEERIALHPLPERDQSRLLAYQSGKIGHYLFKDLPDLLPENSILFFNDTKVIPARLVFHKATGAQIEILLLQPAAMNLPVQITMQSTGSTDWICTIGNLKKWKQGQVQIHQNGLTLSAELVDPREGRVKFTWDPPQMSFAEVVDQCGDTPLPPYLHRKSEAGDKTRYQTVYSQFEGAVAAPTAGLHFTDNILKAIRSKGIITDFLTLHVSAGTFQPIKTENALEHKMHSEQVIITRKNVETLVQTNKKIIAVGTTSLRTLESLYWYGVKLINGESEEFFIDQDYPYIIDNELLPSKKEALNAVLSKMSDEPLAGNTAIYMVPGYQFRVCDGLITNFHQPGSTLMLLVAAFLGPDWREVYSEALNKKYRFLSYGDSSLLLPN